MQTIVKASNDAALLALMPHLLGMHPRNSVVVLGFRGNRTHGALRFDLPAPTGARPSLVYKRVAKAIVGTLGKLPGADGVLVAVVTDARFARSSIPPHLDFVAELTRSIDRSRFGLRAVLCRARDGWAPYFDHDVPAGGYPLSDLVDADVAAQLPADLPPVFDLEMMPRRVPDADDDVKRAVMSAYERFEHEETERRARSLEDSGFGVPDAVEFVEELLDLDEAAFLELAGPLLAMVQSVPVADLLITQWASDAETGHLLVPEAIQFLAGASPAETELQEILFGQSRAPDPGRLDRAIQLVYRLVACAEDFLRPSPLCMLAWLHWALGNGSKAGVYTDEAIGLAPDDEAARWLQSLIRNGVLPDWVFENDDGEE